jgi:hypothetical protein
MGASLWFSQSEYRIRVPNRGCENSRYRSDGGNSVLDLGQRSWQQKTGLGPVFQKTVVRCVASSTVVMS